MLQSETNTIRGRTEVMNIVKKDDADLLSSMKDAADILDIFIETKERGLSLKAAESHLFARMHSLSFFHDKGRFTSAYIAAQLYFALREQTNESCSGDSLREMADIWSEGSDK
jgi:hypothetical protein